MSSSEKISIQDSIQKVRNLLAEDKAISSSLKAAIETIILALTLLMDKYYKNSQNSHKPPSTDLKPKPKPAFPKKRKKREHPGSTIQVQNPDKIVLHKNRKCSCCGEKLGENNLISICKRQVIDIEIKRVVTEHQVEKMLCDCGKESVSKFPEGLMRQVQYSSNIKAQVCYLYATQMLSYNRIALHLSAVCNINISEATIFNFLQEAYHRLEFWEESALDYIYNSKSLYVDETGMKVSQILHWVHTYSTELVTLMFLHSKRGGKAIEDINILENYSGVMVHDCWAPYLGIEGHHGLCGAHLIRELNNASENPNQTWALKIKKLLIEANDRVKKNKSQKLSQQNFIRFAAKYDKIIKLGMKQTLFKPENAFAKESKKEKKSKALLKRLDIHRDSVLRFAKNSDVAFTNNLAERDLRMNKVKQKVSGCFRSFMAGQMYCRLRSYLLSKQKEGIDCLTAIQDIFSNSA